MGDDAELMGEPPLSILDLPAGEVLRIVAQLGIDDKKNVALACKGLCAAVRSQWRILLFNPTSPDLPPPGLAHFSGLHTLVIAAGAPEAARALSREEWEREESFDSAGYAVPPAPDAEAAWPRAHELGALLMEALTGRQGAAAPRRLRLVLGTPKLASAAQLQRAAEAHFTAGGAGSLADIFRVVGADALTLTLTLNPGALVERSAAQPAPASLFDAVAAGWCLLDGGLVSTLVSASYPWCGHTHQSDARLEGYSRLEALRFCGERPPQCLPPCAAPAWRAARPRGALPLRCSPPVPHTFQHRNIASPRAHFSPRPARPTPQSTPATSPPSRPPPPSPRRSPPSSPPRRCPPCGSSTWGAPSAPTPPRRCPFTCSSCRA